MAPDQQPLTTWCSSPHPLEARVWIAQGPISQAIFFHCNVATKLCTCHHDSTAVMPCAWDHSNHWATTWIRKPWNSIDFELHLWPLGIPPCPMGRPRYHRTMFTVSSSLHAALCCMSTEPGNIYRLPTLSIPPLREPEWVYQVPDCVHSPRDCHGVLQYIDSVLHISIFLWWYRVGEDFLHSVWRTVSGSPHW